MQSIQTEAVRGVPAGPGSVALLVASAARPRPGLVRVAGLKPNRHYLLAGAAHRFVRADAAGEATVAVRSDAPALVTLVPVV